MTVSAEETPLLAAEPAVQTTTKRGRIVLACSVVGLVLIAAKGHSRQGATRTAALRAASPSLANTPLPTPGTPQPTGPSSAPTFKPTLNEHSNQYRDFKNTAFTNRSIGIYKRTHATANAAEDVIFQQSVLGNLGQLQLTGEYGVFGVDDDIEGFPEASCMKRSAGIAAGNFSIHDVETEQFHTGTYKPEVWWKYISRVHGPFTPYDFKGWNEFMVRSIVQHTQLPFSLFLKRDETFQVRGACGVFSATRLACRSPSQRAA